VARVRASALSLLAKAFGVAPSLLDPHLLNDQ
jgi:hypothetical protein